MPLVYLSSLDWACVSIILWQPSLYRIGVNCPSTWFPQICWLDTIFGKAPRYICCHDHVNMMLTVAWCQFHIHALYINANSKICLCFLTTYSSSKSEPFKFRLLVRALVFGSFIWQKWFYLNITSPLLHLLALWPSNQRGSRSGKASLVQVMEWPSICPQNIATRIDRTLSHLEFRSVAYS